MAQLKDLVVNGNSRLIGDSMAQTPAAGTNNQEIATTAFVKKAVDDAISQNPATLSAAASVTTAPAVTVSKDTNMSTASSGTYYVNVTASESNGVAKADAGVSKSGFATNQTASKTCTVDPAVTNSAGKFYIPSTSITMADLGGGGDVGIDIYEVASGSQDANVTLSKVDIGSKDTTNYPYYFKVGAAGTTKSVTSGAVTATDGYIAASTPIASGAKSKSVTATERVEYVKLQAGAVTEAGGGLSQGTASGGDLSGGDLSGGGLSGGGLSAGSGEVSLTAGSGAASAGGNITLGTAQSTAPTTGYYISATGSGTVSAKGRGSVNRAAINRAAVSRAAVTRATFSRPVTRAAVTDTRTEGWIPTRSATTVIAAATETVTLAAGTLSAGSIAADSIAAGSGTSNWSDSSSLSSNSKTVYYPIATANCSHSGGGLSKGTASGGGLTGGTLTAGDGSASVTTTPVVTPKISGTVISTGTTSYGITTTKPSGTDGTNFLTLDPDGTVTTTGVASGKGTVNRASVTRAAFSQTVSHATVTCTHSEGWQTAGSHTAEAADSTTVSLGADSTTIGAASATSNAATCSITPSVAAGTNYYMPIVSPAFTGGGTSVTIPPVVSPPTVEYHETGTFVSSTYTPTYGITTTKPSGTDGTNYLTVDATHTENNGSVSGSANITRNAVTYNGAAKGAISKASGTTALASSSSSGTGSITTTAIDPTVTDNFEPYYVPIVTANATGGTASASAAAGVASASVVGMATTTVNTGYYVSASATGGNANASATGGSASVGKGITAGKTVSGADASDSKTGSTASTAIYIVAGACTVNGGGLSQGDPSGGDLSGGDISGGDISGGDLSGGGLTAGAGSASASGNISLGSQTTTQPTSGYYISATGSGSVSRAAINRSAITRATITRASVTRATFSQAVTRAAVTDTHTAGYIPAQSATTVISASTSTVSLAAGTLAAGTSAAATSAATSIAADSKSSNSKTVYYPVTSAVLSNVRVTTAYDDAVPLVTTAGYIATNTIDILTVPASKKITVNVANSTSGSVVASAAIGSATTLTQANIITNGKWSTQTFTPSESVQGPYIGAISCAAITSTYVGSGVPRNSAGQGLVEDYYGSDGTNQRWCRIPYGYYPAGGSKANCTYLYLTDAQLKGWANTCGLGYDAGYAAAKVGTAGAAQVLSGYTFTNSSSVGASGTMTNNGAVSPSGLNCGSSYTIPAGYHNGSGKVTANSLSSQTGVDSGKTAVTAGAMLSGYQGWVNGSKISGTISNGTITNNTSGGSSSGTINRGNQIKIGAGYYSSDKYYTAQSNSGNINLTTNTSTSVNGYATATVRSASASVPSTMSGSSATASLSGTTVTLSKSLTNTASVSTSGWLSSLSGTTSVSLSGTVPTETKSITANGTYTPTSGKLFSSVTVNVSSGSAATLKNVSTSTTSTTGIPIVQTAGTVATNLKLTYVKVPDSKELAVDIDPTDCDIGGGDTPAHISSIHLKKYLYDAQYAEYGSIQCIYSDTVGDDEELDYAPEVHIASGTTSPTNNLSGGVFFGNGQSAVGYRSNVELVVNRNCSIEDFYNGSESGTYPSYITTFNNYSGAYIGHLYNSGTITSIKKYATGYINDFEWYDDSNNNYYLVNNNYPNRVSLKQTTVLSGTSSGIFVHLRASALSSLSYVLDFEASTYGGMYSGTLATTYGTSVSAGRIGITTSAGAGVFFVKNITSSSRTLYYGTSTNGSTVTERNSITIPPYRIALIRCYLDTLNNYKIYIQAELLECSSIK